MRNTLVVAAILAFLACPGACLSIGVQDLSSDMSNSYISKASNLFMRNDLQGALDTLNEAISANPNNPQLYLNRGFLKHVVFDYDGALQDYNTALKINPRFAYAYNNRGVLKVAMKDINGAMADYATALEINKNYSDVYYNRGNLKYMTDDLKGALDDYNIAIELNPKDSEAYNNRGVVKKRLDYNVGALSDYTKAIDLNPKDSIAYANRGRLKKLYFDNEGASIDLNQAVALAENQAFIKNVKPLLSNERYIAAIPSTVSFAYDITENDSVIGSPKNIYGDFDSSYSNKLAMSTSPNYVVPEAKMVKEKPVQTLTEPKYVTPADDVKTASKTNKSSKQSSNSSTPTIKAGVGKVATPNVPDIRTSAVTKNATTNVKLAESYYIRGLQKCVLRDFEGAMADLDKAIANNSKYADAYFYRAAIKKELGDREGFKKDYSTAIQIKPSLQSFNDEDALSLI